MDGQGFGFSVKPPDELTATLRDPPGTVLCLGHVHPDGDVLGTLFGLGLALSAAGASVTFAGPHPVPGVLGFLPGSDRWNVWKTAPTTYDVIVMTDCPNPDRSEGLLEGARGPKSRVLNIDHHPDNRRYGTVDWIDPSAAATGEMIFDLVKALGLRVTPAVLRGLVSREFLAAEDLVGYPRSVGGVKVAVLLREEGPGTIKASLRAKGDVPVNAIAHRFGGGGHENAAGCTLSGTLEEATATLLEAVRESLDAVRPRSPK